MEPNEVKDLVFKLLPALTPLIMELLNWIQDKWLPTAKMPRPIKWVLSAVIGAILASLAGLSPDSVAAGAAVGIAASGGYTIARGKPA